VQERVGGELKQRPPFHPLSKDTWKDEGKENSKTCLQCLHPHPEIKVQSLLGAGVGEIRKYISLPFGSCKANNRKIEK
jgi:hypothetical protein